MRNEHDYYEILNISPHANFEEITESYRKLAFKYHPDRNLMSVDANEKMKEINVAYDAITDNIRRQAAYTPRGQHNGSPKFRMGTKVKINHHSKTYSDHAGIVDKEPVKDTFRYWYMVKIEQKDFSTINRFAEEELEEISD